MALAKAIRAEVAAEVARLRGSGRKPGLAVVLVGEDPGQPVYVRSKGKACEEAGMHSETIRLPGDDLRGRAAGDRWTGSTPIPTIHGILVQLPLPKHINSEKVLNAGSTRPRTWTASIR